jgi:catechol 2,3-dioxygenase-like lactoylglutathione lyase family enzyme
VTDIYPVFAVKNLDEALAYYRDKLGFSVRWTWGNPVVRAGVSIGKVEIQLDEADPGAPSAISNAYCHMTDVEGYFAECRRRGAIIVGELDDRPWGMKDFRVLDPSGNRVGFGEPSAKT